MKLFFAVITAALCHVGILQAVTTVLFDSSQNIELSAEGTTSDTYITRGYIIEVTRDKLFTGGAGMTVPIGRNIRVPWPDGMEAQGITSGPNPGKAKLTIRRVDGQPFGLIAFTVKLLGSTAAGGGSIEVTPVINDGPGPEPDTVPFFLNFPNYGQLNSFYTSQNASYVYNSQISGGPNYDSYKFSLYVDYALTSLTLVDPSPPPQAPPHPALTRLSASNAKIAWPTSGYDYTLQTCTDLANGSWTANFGNAVEEGGLNVVYFDPAEPNRFFRLSD